MLNSILSIIVSGLLGMFITILLIGLYYKIRDWRYKGSNILKYPYFKNRLDCLDEHFKNLMENSGECGKICYKAYLDEKGKS